MIEALGKLRKLAICDKGEVYTAYLDAGDIADAIEAEVAERFMELPVDADGVPIHVGDELSVDGGDFEDGIAEAVGISPVSVFFLDGEDWVAQWANCVSHADKPADGTDAAQRIAELEAELADAKAEIRRLEAQGEYMVRQIAKAKEALR